MNRMVFIMATLLTSLTAFAGLSIPFPDSAAHNLNEIALRDGNNRIIVDGTPGYWNNAANQGNPNMTKEAIFDGNTATFFDPPTEPNLIGGCWAGISFDRPVCVTKIRYKGRPNGAVSQLNQMNGCLFQGANNADFSDAVTLAVANRNDDRTDKTTAWNGVNYWCEIVVPFECSLENSLSKVARARFFRYLRIIGPNAYVQGASTQDGTCCGNASEVEFYGVPAELADSSPLLKNEEYRPQVSGAQLGTGDMSFDVTFRFPESNSAIGEPVKKIFGYEVFRRYPASDGLGVALTELAEAGFAITHGSNNEITFTFTETNVLPRVTYEVRSFNAATNSPGTVFATPDVPVFPAISSVLPDDGDDSNARITWTHSDRAGNADGVIVERATAPGGPWTSLHEGALPVADTFFIDETLAGGVVYYYQVKYVFRMPGTDESDPGYPGLASPPIAYRKIVNIERTWNEAHTSSQLKTGMKAICQFKPWNASDADYQTEFPGNAGSPLNLFDYDFNTHSDIQPKGSNTMRDDGTCKAGVDLGKAYVITKAMVRPRAGSGNDEVGKRFARMALFASNADSVGEADGWRDDANCSQITAKFTKPNPYNSFIEVEVTDPTPYRYVFVKHAEFPVVRSQEAFANASELMLFGYDPNEAPADVLIAPLAVTNELYETSDNPFGKVGVSLTWDASPNAQSYRVERRTGSSDEWEVIAEGLTATAYFWENVDGGEPGEFRVASVRDAEIAYSRMVQPAQRGYGTGLWTIYTSPYESNWLKSKKWIKRVDAAIDYNWGANAIIDDCADSTNDIFMTWTGRLIVPVTGLYNFKAETDGGFALRINAIQVINNWSGKRGASFFEGEMFLEAGEHRIRADYQSYTTNRVANKFCRLLWGGPVPDQVIPASQLIPEKASEMTYPWRGERTFSSPVKGYTYFTPEPDENGVMHDGFTISGAGGDFWLQVDTCQWAWRMVTGDFSISARFERLINVTPGMGNDSGWAWKGMLISRKGLGEAVPTVTACYASNGFNGRADLKVRNARHTDIFDHLDRVWNLPPVVYQKLQRVGNVFTQSFSEDGENWEVVKTYVDEDHLMEGVLYVGPAVSAIADLMQLGTYKVTIVKVTSGSGTGIVLVR